MTNKEIINDKYPNLVKNWGESAQLLSFKQVIELMDLARKDHEGLLVKFMGWLEGLGADPAYYYKTSEEAVKAFLEDMKDDNDETPEEAAKSAFEVMEVTIGGFDDIKVAEPRLRISQASSCDEQLEIILTNEKDVQTFMEWMEQVQPSGGELSPKGSYIRGGTWKTRGFGEGKLVGIYPIHVEEFNIDLPEPIEIKATVRIDYQTTSPNTINNF